MYKQKSNANNQQNKQLALWENQQNRQSLIQTN